MSEIAAGSPLPRQAPEGTSFFALLFGGWFLLLTAFFGVSLAAIALRSQPVSDRTDPPSTVPVEVQEPPTTKQPASNEPRRAIVSVPRDLKNGVVRAEPRIDAQMVGGIPDGEAVEVKSCWAVKGRKGLENWCRVKGTSFGRPVEGWMHSDILR